MGSLVQFLGPGKSGKTALALNVAATAQRTGMVCAWVDADKEFDADRAGAVGVDLSRLWVARPATGELALRLLDRLAESSQVGLVIFDSFKVPQQRPDMSSHAGLQSRVVRRMMMGCSRSLEQQGTTLLLLSQDLDDQIPYRGTVRTTLNHYSSVVMHTRPIGGFRGSDSETDIIVRARVTKNKHGPAFTETNFRLRNGEAVAL